MTGETVTRPLANLRLPGVVGVVVWGCLAGCAKTDVQAPAKEAPSATSVAPEAVEAEAPPPPSSSASADRWPAAEQKPAAAVGAGPGGAPPSAPAPVLAPAPREKSDAAKQKKESAPRAAATPAKGALSGSGGRSPVADEAEPALAITESWTQLNFAFDGLASALALAVPDCSAAERFRQNVCALAEHICALERDLPSTTPHNCSDGRSRCSEATSRYNAKCDR